MTFEVIYRDKCGRSIERVGFVNPKPRTIQRILIDAIEKVDCKSHPLYRGFTVHYNEGNNENA